MNTSLPDTPKTHWLTRLFAPPRMPLRFALLVLLLIASHVAQTLMDLPAGYWINPRVPDNQYFLPVLSSRGPWLLLGLIALYMAVVGLLLTRLERIKAFALAGALFLSHLSYLTSYSNCRIPPFGWVLKTGDCGMTITAQKWIWVVPLLLMVISLFPLPFRLPARRWFTALGLLLAAGWLGVQVYGVVREIVPTRTGWQALALENAPAPREQMGIAYDTARQRAVLFGGQGISKKNEYILFDDTWEWDGSGWVQIHTEISPPARRIPSFAYDEKRGVVVLYGGFNNNGILQDVWEYDGRQWMERCPYCTPAARWGATMLYNQEMQKLVLYGGVGGQGKQQNIWYTEAWSWDGFSWQYTGIDTAAPAAFKPGLMYDPELQRTLAFVDQEYGGMWMWDDNVWQKPILGVQPPHGSGVSWVYDPQYGRSVLYGGVQNPGGLQHNQTWVFNGVVWLQLVSPRSPMPRSDQIAFYDPTRHSMILFGGRGINEKMLNDTWELPLTGPTPGVTGEETLEH